MQPWRWFDGHRWTDPPRQRRRLPAWLSWPVLICAMFAVPAVGYLAVRSPITPALAALPLVAALTIIRWIDRVEPEPTHQLVHAVLWGATVAVAVSFAVNTAAAGVLGLNVAIVAVAPVIEETTKALLLVMCMRRRLIDGPLDGAVYAAAVAVGFAAVENIVYFTAAAEADQLGLTFIGRAVLTPFAHPMFTVWTGLAIGVAVRAGRSWRWAGLAGLVGAVSVHSAWNGALTVAQDTGNPFVAVGALVGFIGLFTATTVTLAAVRSRLRDRFVTMMPFLAARYQLSAVEYATFANWSTARRTRRTLNRSQRHQFDRIHAALARLAAFHDRPRSGHDPLIEHELVAALHTARQHP